MNGILQNWALRLIKNGRFKHSWSLSITYEVHGSKYPLHGDALSKRWCSRPDPAFEAFYSYTLQLRRFHCQAAGTFSDPSTSSMAIDSELGALNHHQTIFLCFCIFSIMPCFTWNIGLITFIQPWYKALRSSRSSGTLNTVVSGINACICLIALHIWPPDLRVQQLQDLMGLLFYVSGPRFFHNLSYNTFSLKNVARIVTQFDLLSCLFSACKSQTEYFKCT